MDREELKLGSINAVFEFDRSIVLSASYGEDVCLSPEQADALAFALVERGYGRVFGVPALDTIADDSDTLRPGEMLALHDDSGL